MSFFLSLKCGLHKIFLKSYTASIHIQWDVCYQNTKLMILFIKRHKNIATSREVFCPQKKKKKLHFGETCLVKIQNRWYCSPKGTKTSLHLVSFCKIHHGHTLNNMEFCLSLTSSRFYMSTKPQIIRVCLVHVFKQ